MSTTLGNDDKYYLPDIVDDDEGGYLSNREHFTEPEAILCFTEL